MNKQKISNTPGFTIVELLVVIVIIGILAAITIVSYTGITQRANTVSIQSDLANASQQLKVYQADNNAYPTSLDANNCPVPADTIISCLKPSAGTTFQYTANNTTSPQSFALTATKSSISYIIANDTTPAPISTTASSLSCPAGFIPVPGSITYGTADFCVMKYEAKNVGGVATSQAALTPWVSINQTSAITTAAAACTGCHLVTEDEWSTIAQNVLSVPSNWSTGTVGTGYIYSGHNDSAPNNSLAADPSDANNYAGETNTGGNQRRTLTLTNGQVIWDLAGNVWEWTSGTTTGKQPGIISGGYAYREWTALTTHGSLSPDPSPSITGISGAGSWNSSNGIGHMYSSADETVLRSFYRGGNWGNFGHAGVMALSINLAPTDSYTDTGFRVSR